MLPWMPYVCIFECKMVVDIHYIYYYPLPTPYIVSCSDVHAHRRRMSGGLSYISCHRGVSSVGVIEALIVLRMQLSEKFEDKRSFLVM